MSILARAPHCGEYPVHQIAIFGLIFQDFPSSKHGDHLFFGKDHEPLAAEAPCHPYESLPIGSRQEPPLESVLVVFLRVSQGRNGLLNPISRNDLLRAPAAAVLVEVSDLRQVGVLQKQTAFGVDHTQWRALPEMVHSQWREQVFRSVLL